MDALCDVLYAADKTLAALKREDAQAAYAWIEPQIQNVYDTVNELLKKLSD